MVCVAGVCLVVLVRRDCEMFVVDRFPPHYEWGLTSGTRIPGDGPPVFLFLARSLGSLPCVFFPYDHPHENIRIGEMSSRLFLLKMMVVSLKEKLGVYPSLNKEKETSANTSLVFHAGDFRRRSRGLHTLPYARVCCLRPESIHRGRVLILPWYIVVLVMMLMLMLLMLGCSGFLTTRRADLFHAEVLLRPILHVPPCDGCLHPSSNLST